VNPKWRCILFIFVALILACSVVACTECYTEDDLSAARDAGYDEGYVIGLDECDSFEQLAYDRGYEDGYAEGEDKGYEYGEDIGYENGYEIGYQNGFWDGEEEASQSYKTIAEDNYDQGYIEGYEDCLNGYSDFYESLQEGIPVSTHDASDFFIEAISLTSPVSPGEYATIEVKTLPNELLMIEVHYASGKSEAAGLVPKRSDDEGNIWWIWKVGTRTTPGTWKIIIASLNMDWWFKGYENITKTVYFEVN